MGVGHANIVWRCDLASPSHHLHVEMSKNQGECVLKIRCCICCTLISYYNSLWTCAATHFWSHNITTAQDIAAADALAFDVWGQWWTLPYPQATNSTYSEEGSHRQRCPRATHLCCPVLRAQYTTLQFDQENNYKMDSRGLPSIQDSGDAHI